MHVKSVSQIIALVLLSGIVTSDCTRTAFLGGPQNTIIKAYEGLGELMQVANLKTSVYYIDEHNDMAAEEGSSYVEYIFRVDVENDDGTTTQYGLLMQVSVFCNETFVDQILFIDLAEQHMGVIPPTYTYDNVTTAVDGLFGSTDPSNEIVFDAMSITDDDFIQPCNILKEAFTYFYEIAGDNFAKNLNN